MNSDTLELQHRLESNIRQRTFREQYPELNGLLDVIERVDAQVEKTSKTVAELSGCRPIRI